MAAHTPPPPSESSQTTRFLVGTAYCAVYYHYHYCSEHRISSLLKSPPMTALQFHRIAIHRLLNSPPSHYTADKLHRLVNLRHDEFSADEIFASQHTDAQSSV